jgi:hypothetical protein
MHSSKILAVDKYYTGSRFSNKNGEWFTVLGYEDHSSVTIIFDIDKIPRVVKSKDINRCCLRAKNAITIAGIACLGEGPYEAADSLGKPHKPYKLFRHMLDRCYTEAYRQKNLNYADCSVLPIWYNYQNFAAWYYEQPGRDIGNFQLDKDLTGSRVYGPEFCYFIPKVINSTLRTVAEKKNIDLPRGVSLSVGTKLPYVSTYRDTGSTKLERFLTINEARSHYVECTKNKLINVAKSYGSDLHPNVVTLLEQYDWENL